MAQRFPAKRRRRKLGVALLLLLLTGGVLAGWMYRTAQADPAVRRAEIALPGLTEPLRAILLSDLHVARPDMPPERLARIAAEVNALRPDIVLIAGDFVGDGWLQTQVTPAQAVAPLKALRSRLGTFAVLGNHDHWNDAPAIAAALRANGVRLLVNEAVQAGPLVLGGLDDDFTRRADMSGTLRAMEGLSGARLILSHDPDPFAYLPRDVPLMLAGHTHCGQIRFPLVGAITYESDYGARYGCGEVSEGGKRLIVGGGLGTSVLPLRLGAVPELWVVELRPAPIFPIADGEGNHP